MKYAHVRSIPGRCLRTTGKALLLLSLCAGCNQTATPVGSTTTQAGATAAPMAAAATPAQSTKINDNDQSIIYSKGNGSTQDWYYFQPAPEDYLQDEHSSNVIRSGGAITGIGAVVNFTGTGITWIGKRGPQYGVASYSIDGGPPKTVDNYNATQIDQNPQVSVSGLSADSHVLSISLLDQKNASSTDYCQTIDAFNIEGSPLARSAATLAGFNSAELKFTGTWGGGWVSDGSDLSGGHYWSNETNASISWTFVGSLIEVFGRPDYEDGYMDVYIDAEPNPVASVNGHWGTTDDDTLNSYMLFARKLTPGQHTIRIVVAGRKDNSARDNFVQIDELIAFQ